MKSERLYYSDAYEINFTAVVLECVSRGEYFAVSLNQTGFYPEGGGQPADNGVLSLDAKDVKVFDVHEREGAVWHYVNEPIAAGSSVNGKIDFARRFDFMQNHSGEHIISGVIKRLYGLNNVGFHIGAEFITIDTDGPLSFEQIALIEEESNNAVFGNASISAVTEVNPQTEYRSKKELSGEVRLVTVDGYDSCACCGLHVRNAGEIGLIKIVNAQKYKAGMRLFILCGKRALDDYRVKNKQVYDISVLLSSKPGEVCGAVRKLADDYAGAKYRYGAVKSELLKIKARSIGNEGVVVVCEDDLTPDELREYCNLLREKAETAVALTPDKDGFRYAAACGNTDARDLAKFLNKRFNGRGGGTERICQGYLTGNIDVIKEAVKQSFNCINNH
jgi:alanyl-tRNA synthetase